MNEAGDKSTDAAFLEKCRSKLQNLETVRLAKLRDFMRRKKIAIPVSAVLTPILGFIDYWLYLLQRGSDDTFVGLTVIVLGGLWLWVSAPKRAYAKAYKTEILPEIIRLYGDFEYDVRGKIPMATMKPLGIVPRHTSYSSEDYFTGEHHGIGVSFSEINLSKKQGKQRVTVFKGLAVLFSHGTRKFHGHTILTNDQSGFGQKLTQQKLKLKRANMVDLEFERLFDVFTNDQVEARYLIDPVIIENIKALYNEYNGKQLRVAFRDGHVLILIASDKNHFEPPKIQIPATDEAELLAMKREISQILAIIERLSLYDPKTKRLLAKAG